LGLLIGVLFGELLLLRITLPLNPSILLLLVALRLWLCLRLLSVGEVSMGCACWLFLSWSCTGECG
jgi:hypothetical protein